LRILVANGPDTLPRLHEIGIDPLALAFALGVSVLSGALFGVIPVLKYAGPRVATALRSVGRTSSHGRQRHRARNTLVVVQVALALVLLVSSGLMIRTFQRLRSVQPGFTHPEEIQILHSMLPAAVAEEPERVMRMQHEILETLAAIPGVTSVGLSARHSNRFWAAPIRSRPRTRFSRAGPPPANPQDRRILRDDGNTSRRDATSADRPATAARRHRVGESGARVVGDPVLPLASGFAKSALPILARSSASSKTSTTTVVEAARLTYRRLMDRYSGAARTDPPLCPACSRSVPTGRVRRVCWPRRSKPSGP
jgi:hypothetical protein